MWSRRFLTRGFSTHDHIIGVRALSQSSLAGENRRNQTNLSGSPAGWRPRSWRRIRRQGRSQAGVVIILCIVVAVLLASWLAPYPVDEQRLDFIRVAPNRHFLLGTDSLGRDLLSRLLYGARIALLIGLIVVVIEVTIGVPLGLIGGYFQGKPDLLISTLTDIVWAFPPLVLAPGIVAAVGPGLFNSVIAIAQFSV